MISFAYICLIIYIYIIHNCIVFDYHAIFWTCLEEVWTAWTASSVKCKAILPLRDATLELNFWQNDVIMWNENRTRIKAARTGSQCHGTSRSLSTCDTCRLAKELMWGHANFIKFHPGVVSALWERWALRTSWFVLWVANKHTKNEHAIVIPTSHSIAR